MEPWQMAEELREAPGGSPCWSDTRGPCLDPRGSASGAGLPWGPGGAETAGGGRGTPEGLGDSAHWTASASPELERDRLPCLQEEASGPEDSVGGIGPCRQGVPECPYRAAGSLNKWHGRDPAWGVSRPATTPARRCWGLGWWRGPGAEERPTSLLARAGEVEG
ncbi:hypothetical protein NDU88_009702 [Pleurodeles waltl]|uniref:Uncharacterized protein n=1 Tax=Pleurodeles waltl TaxID=8319 RepID=A0AAV7QTJ8_PLEWA|nr:hypothetical protein NDU88_009702 [Pleurodeles waltl]